MTGINKEHGKQQTLAGPREPRGQVVVVVVIFCYYVDVLTEYSYSVDVLYIAIHTWRIRCARNEIFTYLRVI